MSAYTYLPFAALLAAASCVSDAPQGPATTSFNGQSTTTATTLTGSAAGIPGGAGEATMTLSDGRACTAAYDFDTSGTGLGDVTCDDGSTGTFEFRASANGGSGTAVVGGETFQFQFISRG